MSQEFERVRVVECLFKILAEFETAEMSLLSWNEYKVARMSYGMSLAWWWLNNGSILNSWRESQMAYGDSIVMALSRFITRVGWRTCYLRLKESIKQANSTSKWMNSTLEQFISMHTCSLLGVLTLMAASRSVSS